VNNLVDVTETALSKKSDDRKVPEKLPVPQDLAIFTVGHLRSERSQHGNKKSRNVLVT
jgi:hypothetical protein